MLKQDNQNKQDKNQALKRYLRRRRIIIILSIVLILIVLLLAFTNIGGDINFVVHFFTPPRHFTYSGHSDGVNAVAWSPNGKRIASASSDSSVQVWDAGNGGHVFTYRGHTSDVFTVAWSSDGKYIASGGLDKT